jgi:hypothetical protein
MPSSNPLPPQEANLFKKILVKIKYLNFEFAFTKHKYFTEIIRAKTIQKESSVCKRDFKKVSRTRRYLPFISANKQLHNYLIIFFRNSFNEGSYPKLYE